MTLLPPAETLQVEPDHEYRRAFILGAFAGAGTVLTFAAAAVGIWLTIN